MTLESKEDEKRRESAITDRAHVNDHGGRQAEMEFWDKHRKKGGAATPDRHAHHHHDSKKDLGHEHVETLDGPAGHVTAKDEKEKHGGPVTGTLL